MLRCIYASIQKNVVFLLQKSQQKLMKRLCFFESFSGKKLLPVAQKQCILQMQQDDKYKDFSFFWGLRKTDREDFS